MESAFIETVKVAIVPYVLDPQSLSLAGFEQEIEIPTQLDKTISNKLKWVQNPRNTICALLRVAVV